MHESSLIVRKFAALLLSMNVVAQAAPLYINYSATIDAAELAKHDLSIIDPHAKTSLAAAHEQGRHVLAYVSLVELAKGSPADAAAKTRAVPFVGTNHEWSSHLLDIRSRAWKDFILEDCITNAFAHHFDGVFLDTLDSVEHLAAKDRQALAEYRKILINLVVQIRTRWPSKMIIVNRGFELLGSISAKIDGVLVESVYHSFDPATKRYRAMSKDDSKWTEERIVEARRLGLKVYAVDYLAVEDKASAKQAAEKLRKLSCVPLITTHELLGEVLAP